jgi:AcrR family transcriptional regulator
METAAVKAPGSRQRFIDVAVRLFSRHSFAGTSLQMIADELSVSKAAVYHHFHSREALLTAVVEPMVTQMRATVVEAEKQRTPHARAEHMLTGFVDIVIDNRDLVPLLVFDSGARQVLQTIHGPGDFSDRQIALLAEADPGPMGTVKAAVAVTGLAGAVGLRDNELGDDVLRRQLLDIGRRILGLRAPRSR